MNEGFQSTGFYFELSISGADEKVLFQEVSGIASTVEVESIPEGNGDNLFVHKVPGRMHATNLVLKRGLVSNNGALIRWCSATLEGGLGNALQTKDLTLKLIGHDGGALQVWLFENAFPVKWELDYLGDSDKEMAVAKIEFAFSYFEKAD